MAQAIHTPVTRKQYKCKYVHVKREIKKVKFSMADVYATSNSGVSSDDDNEELIIYLSDLLVNKSDISLELSHGGGLLLSSSSSSSSSSSPINDSMAICILRGLSVYSSDGQMRIPHISLGSLVLRSLYFAADYTSGGVGLANKHNTSTSSTFDNNVYTCPFCKSKVHCIGQQRLDDFSNTCVDPDCSSYFFVIMDGDSHTYDDIYISYGLIV